MWGSKWKLLEATAIFLVIISQVSNMRESGSGFKLCHCSSIKSWFLLVIVQIPQGTRLQSISLLEKDDTEISDAYVKENGAFLTTNIIEYMPEDEDKKMNHF